MGDNSISIGVDLWFEVDLYLEVEKFDVGPKGLAAHTVSSVKHWIESGCKL